MGSLKFNSLQKKKKEETRTIKCNAMVRFDIIIPASSDLTRNDIDIVMKEKFVTTYKDKAKKEPVKVKKLPEKIKINFEPKRRQYNE